MTNKKILFIDDQLEDWEGFLRRGLKEFGYEVVGEEFPSNALKMIAAHGPDAVLLDILYPGGQFLGKPTLENIKKNYPDLPVMMITSTMDKTEYRSEDYRLADYRYAKAALASGDCSDLAAQLDRIIEAASKKQQDTHKDTTGVGRYGFIVGQTKVMQEVAQIVEKVADQNHTVLITGESGTGKGLVAEAIHNLSKRHDRNFVTIVCAAMPKELLESELFGHEKGAFTGAQSRKIGKFEAAGDGTIFLDEIGEMPPDTQVKLLRFLHEREFERVGGNEVITSKARIIAATNRTLEELVRQGKFREDLFYRLSVVRIHMPPLRDRKDEIPLFLEYFVEKANRRSNTKIMPILRDDLKGLFVSYSWPGNIRELEHMIERAVALADENILQVNNFPDLLNDRKPTIGISSGLDDIVNKIFDGKFAWQNFKEEFGARGEMRQEILLQTIQRWLDKNNQRPNYKDLARLLSVSEGNMRRILSECGIKLTELNI